jgi:hypothetical protein
MKVVTLDVTVIKKVRAFHGCNHFFQKFLGSTTEVFMIPMSVYIDAFVGWLKRQVIGAGSCTGYRVKVANKVNVALSDV